MVKFLGMAKHYINDVVHITKMVVMAIDYRISLNDIGH